MPQKVKKAVFPVAGWGSRFLPATKTMPKEMLAVVDKPVIQYAVEEAMDAGIEEFIFVTGRGKETIENHFDSNYELEETLKAAGKTAALESITRIVPPEGKIFYTRQSRRLGLGHAVGCARSIVGNEPFAVLLPDDIMLARDGTNMLKKMVENYENTGVSNVLCMEVSAEKTERYGVLNTGGHVVKNGQVKVEGFVEKPKKEVAPSNLAVMGRYVFSPEIFPLLAETKPGAGNEIQLTDAMHQLAQKTGFEGVLLDGMRLDCGDKPGFVQANIYMALQRPDLRDEIIHFIKKLEI